MEGWPSSSFGPDQIPELPGDPASLRAATAVVREAATRLDAARAAAGRAESMLDDLAWRGNAFVAFRSGVESQGLPAHLWSATEALTACADVLQRLAGRLDDLAERVQGLRSRTRSLGIDGPVADELRSDVDLIAEEYDEIEAEARAARDEASATLAELASRTVVAGWVPASAPEVGGPVDPSALGVDVAGAPAEASDLVSVPAYVADPLPTTLGPHFDADVVAAAIGDRAVGTDVAVPWDAVRADPLRWLGHPVVDVPIGSDVAASHDRLGRLEDLLFSPDEP